MPVISKTDHFSEGNGALQTVCRAWFCSKHLLLSLLNFLGLSKHLCYWP